jgi:hypothetical protein
VTGRCKTHHILGTIRYPETSDENSVGKILYIKSSLTGTIKREHLSDLPCESLDILSYRFEHCTFPHDTTANQWFTESQFEIGAHRRAVNQGAKPEGHCAGRTSPLYPPTKT